MDHGIKISKPGYNVDGQLGKEIKPSVKVEPYLLYVLATPYVMGAHVQVERYKRAAATLHSHPVASTHACLHEISCLFEDLNAIGKYAEMCGNQNTRNKLWLDVRNHIRHDTREEYDKEGEEQKNSRAIRLGLDRRLQTNIGFSESAITIGATVIPLSDIESYIAWADGIIGSVIQEAQANGRIKEYGSAEQN